MINQPVIFGYVDEDGVLQQRVETNTPDVSELRTKITKATTLAQIKAPLLEVLDLLEKGES